MIYRRREAEEVRPGLNILWEPLAKNAILRVGKHSLYVTWNRHTRRLSFAMPFTTLNPWRKIRELEARLITVASECRALDHALHQSNERYDKIRETNAQLRDALSLYRNT